MSDSHANGLPATHTPFVGRDDERAEIVRLFADPACRLLTLTGPGGIGKTRLAVEAARILANDDSVGTLGAGSLPTTSFPHGVPFVPLQPLSSPEFRCATRKHHLALVDAIAARASDAARKAVHQQVDEALAHLVDLHRAVRE